MEKENESVLIKVESWLERAVLRNTVQSNDFNGEVRLDSTWM